MWSRFQLGLRCRVLSAKVHVLFNVHASECISCAVGSSVSLSAGEEVAGLLPLDSECPGCAEYCVLPEYCLVTKPSNVSHTDCAAALRGGLMGYTALYHQARLEPGAIVLLCSAMEGERMIMLQLCDLLGAKVCTPQGCDA